jgi:hypothetical protein
MNVACTVDEHYGHISKYTRIVLNHCHESRMSVSWHEMFGQSLSKNFEWRKLDSDKGIEATVKLSSLSITTLWDERQFSTVEVHPISEEPIACIFRVE